MKEAFVPLPSEFINLFFYKLLSLLLEAGPQKCKKNQTNQPKKKKTREDLNIYITLKYAQKTKGTETQVSNHFKLSDLPALAENNNFKKLCGS